MRMKKLLSLLCAATFALSAVGGLPAGAEPVNTGELTIGESEWNANFQLNEETGELSWDSCEEIETAYGNGTVYGVYVNGENLTFIGRNWYGSSPKLSMKPVQLLASEVYFNGDKSLIGDLTITVMAGDWNIYSGSTSPDFFRSSDSFSFTYDGCDFNADLKAPTNLWVYPESNYSNSIVWDPPKGAVAYLTRLTGESGVRNASRIDNTDYPVNWKFSWDQNLPDGEYTYEVCAIDKNGDIGEWSKPVKFTVVNNEVTDEPLGYPEALHEDEEGNVFATANIHIDESGNLVWHTATGASGYRVYIKGNSVDITEETTENVLKDINAFLKEYPNGDYTIAVSACNEIGIERKREGETFVFTKYDTGFFDEENETSSAVETPPEAAEIPESDRVTSITINPAFNMKNKNDTNVELDLTKIKIKAKEIYDEAGLKRAEEALGEEIIGNKHYNLLDLTLLYDGQDFSNGYEGLVQVVIPLPKGHRNKTFSCYRLTEVNGKMTKEVIPGEQTEESYIIYLEHFSEYALVADGGETPDDPSHSHSFSAEWKSDGNSHWHECSCGEKSGLAAHTAGEWIVNSAAGYRHRDCIVCGAVLETASLSGGSPSGSRPVTNPSAPTGTTNTENTDKVNDPADPKDEEPEEPEPDEADREGDVDADTDENDGDDDEEDGEDNEPENDGYDDTFSKDDTDGNDAEESSPTVTPEEIARDENPGTGVPANTAMIFGFLISGAAAAALRKKKKLPRRD